MSEGFRSVLLTIAVCYLSPEGIVLGADSTTTFSGGEGHHFYNHAQKLFEIGENSTFALVTWGLASFNGTSYRRLIAQLADSFIATPPASIKDVADAWVAIAWPVFSALPQFKRVQELDKNAKRTDDEDKEYNQLKAGLVVGFCIGGYCLPDRLGRAFEIVFDPLSTPSPSEIAPLSQKWWGVPNIISRMIHGSDVNLRTSILASGMWSGTPEQLDSILADQALLHPILPIREAVDFVHSCIRSTGKAMKFSINPQFCGGPPEVAVITSDRAFRWVRHKSWDTAIIDGG